VDLTNRTPATVSGVVVTNTPAQLAAAAVATNVPFLHKPYAERNCTACHLSEMSQELRASGSALCLGCHDKLIGNAKYVHTPVADGRCDLCHAAHEAPNRYLLARKVSEVCLDCHDDSLIGKMPVHAVADYPLCTQCHDPHRSEQRYLARGKP
jgi:predicted CXXCH cytochrome family protein